MKAFVIMLDSLVGLSFLMFVMIIISTHTYHHKTPDGIHLKQLSLDTMTVLEKTGRIDQALSGNPGAIDEIVEATPNLACMEVLLLNISGNAVVSTIKSNCDERTGTNIQVTTKPVYHEGQTYILKSRSWFRKEAD